MRVISMGSAQEEALLPLLHFGEVQRRVVFPEAEHAAARFLRRAVALERAERFADAVARRITGESRIDRDAQPDRIELAGGELAELPDLFDVDEARRVDFGRHAPELVHDR